MLALTNCLNIPMLLARLTLMSYSFSNRTLPIAGFACTILLIRVMALENHDKAEMNAEKTGREIALLMAISLFCTVLFVRFTYKGNEEYFNDLMLLGEVILFTLLFAGTLIPASKVRKMWSLLMIAACLVSGLLANPVRAGTEDIDAIPALQMVKEVVQEDPQAVWIGEGSLFQTNMLLLKGARTINSTNIYPKLDRWKSLDPEGKYIEIYNRYGYIQIIYSNDKDIENKFVLDQADVITAYLNAEDLEKLGVNYIFSTNDLSDDSSMSLVKSNGEYSIYRFGGSS